MTPYKPGNKFADQIRLADAAVNWHQLKLEQLNRVHINDDGLPELQGEPELLERAHALMLACQAGLIKGMTFTEDGNGIRPDQMLLDRSSVAGWIKRTEDRLSQLPTEAAFTSKEPAEKLFTQEEVLQQLKIGRTTLYRLIKSGVFPAATHKNKNRWPASAIAHEQARNAVGDASNSAAAALQKQKKPTKSSLDDI